MKQRLQAEKELEERDIIEGRNLPRVSTRIPAALLTSDGKKKNKIYKKFLINHFSKKKIIIIKGDDDDNNDDDELPRGRRIFNDLEEIGPLDEDDLVNKNKKIINEKKNK